MENLFPNDESPELENKEPVQFETALADLERIVRELEDGQIGLEESLSRYEKGVSLLRLCYSRLRDAEQRILKLTGQNEDGGPILQPFEHPSQSPLKKNSNGPRLRKSEEE